MDELLRWHAAYGPETQLRSRLRLRLRLRRKSGSPKERFTADTLGTGYNRAVRPNDQKPPLMTDITQILSQIESGDPSVTEQLLPLVYEQLRKLTAANLTREKPGQTLQATALVHEAYLRLVGGNDAQNWNGCGHFFGAAAEAMRRILIDQARRKRSDRHGGNFQRVELTAIEPTAPVNQVNLLALDEALDKLAARDPRAAELVKLRFFAGLTLSEAATTLGVSVGTAENDWAYAKSWLKLQLSTSSSNSS